MAGKFKQFFQKIVSRVESEIKEVQDVQQEEQQQQRSTQSKQAVQNFLIGKQPAKKASKMIKSIDGFFYMTERIIMCPYPEENLIEPISNFLNETHPNQYIVYNLSEFKYDNSYFNNSVMEYSFPGLPCPSLDNIFMICTSMQSWLSIDPKNIIVIHCQGTKGRSSLLASCFLSFFYFKEFDGPRETYKFYCQIAGLNPMELLYPSQWRYLRYFEEVLNGFIPLNKPLILQRIIMNGIPDIQGMEVDDNDEEDENNGSDDENLSKNNNKQKQLRILCTPYIQVFKNGHRIFQTLQRKKIPDSFYFKDSCAIFEVGQRVENDILLRFRHFKNNQSRVSMFRATVHTSFVVDNVLRLTREDLDGASHNDSYPKDFFIDLIFTDARNHTNLHLSNMQSSNNSVQKIDYKKQQNQIKNERVYPPEEECKETPMMANIEEEEKLLMSGSKNLENKDDFWITLSQQLQDRQDDEETRQKKQEFYQQQKDYREQKHIEILTDYNLKADLQHSSSPKQRSSDASYTDKNSLHVSSPTSSNGSSNNKYDSEKTFALAHDEVTADGNDPELSKQLTVEEQQKIQKMIETPDGGEEEEDDVDLDHYLDKLENESD